MTNEFKPLRGQLSKLLLVLFFLLASFISEKSQAFTLFDTANTIEPKTHSMGLEFPVFFTDDEGLAVQGRYKYGISDYANIQGVVGTSGDNTGFRVGALGSYYLLPDLDNQPGITLFADYYLSRFLSHNQWVLRAGPMVHKEFLGDTVNYNAYIGLPMGLVLRDGRYWNIASLTLGSTIRPASWRNIKFVAEVGIDLSRWHNYISVGASIDFDSFSNIRFN